MIVYFVLFTVFAITVGWSLAITYERRLDVLYGPFLPPDVRKRARSRPAMLIEHLPLIATITVVLCVFAFIADASSP
jgi:hypothetical protein